MARRRILIPILIFTTVITVGLGLFTQNTVSPVSAQVREAQLSLSPGSGDYPVGQDFTVAVNLDGSCSSTPEYGNECGIVGVDIRLDYDDEYLEVVEIKNHALDTETILPEIGNGQIRVARGDLEGAAPTTDLTLFEIVFRGTADGLADVSFSQYQEIIGDFPGERDKTITVTSKTGSSYQIGVLPTGTLAPQPTATATLPPGETPTLTPVPGQRQARLSLFPSSGSYEAGGEAFVISSRLEGVGQEYGIIGIDIRLEFNEALLNLEDISWDETKFNQRIDVSTVEEANNTGQIKVALGNTLDEVPQTPFNLFDLRFAGVAPGTAEVAYTSIADQEIIGDFPGEKDKTISVTSTSDGSYEIVSVSGQREAQLSLSPGSGDYPVGQDFTVAVNLDGSCSSTPEYGNECGIVGVDIRLDYDDEYLEVVEIKNHALDTETMPPEIGNGQIRVARGDLEGAAPTTDLTLFEIVFRGTADGLADVSFSQYQEIIGDFPGERDKTIPVTGKTGGNYQIGEQPGETPTPTPIPEQRKAELSLIPSSGNYEVGGEAFVISSRLEGVGQEYGIVGFGIKLNFDKTRLQLEDISWDETKFNQEIDVSTINEANTTGRIRVALGNTLDEVPQTPFSLFDLRFAGIAPGEANVAYTSVGDQEIIGDFPGEMDKTIRVVEATGGSYNLVGDVTPTPTPTGGECEVEFEFIIRLQGIFGWRPPQDFELIIKRGDEIIARITVTAIADKEGYYKVHVCLMVDPGEYDIFVKGPRHLQKKFGSINLQRGKNFKDWSDIKLLAGDIQEVEGSWNRLDIHDIVLLSQEFGSRMPPEGSRADCDLDGDVDIFDLAYIAENFGKTGDE